jgi:hypothetical protein
MDNLQRDFFLVGISLVTTGGIAFSGAYYLANQGEFDSWDSNYQKNFEDRLELSITSPSLDLATSQLSP